MGQDGAGGLGGGQITQALTECGKYCLVYSKCMDCQ